MEDVGSLWETFRIADEEQPVEEFSSHDELCPWGTTRLCVCDILWEARREAFNEGWRDGFEEGSMWIGVELSGD